MSNVVEFKRPEPPTLQGTAQCCGCGHLWEAVAPVGTCRLECPKCGTNRGVWRNLVEASPGDAEFKCNHCDGIALTAIKRHGRFYLLCMGCGVDQTEAIFG